MSFDDYFFVQPGFIRGAARVLDVGGNLNHGSYLMSDTPAEADARALASDWAAVDRDLAAAATSLANGEEEKAA